MYECHSNHIIFVDSFKTGPDDVVDWIDIVDDLKEQYPNHTIVISKNKKIIGVAYLEEHYYFLELTYKTIDAGHLDLLEEDEIYSLFIAFNNGRFKKIEHFQLKVEEI